MLSWSEWWHGTISNVRFPFSLEDAKIQVLARATKFCQVAQYSVPELGDFTALESWLMEAATLDATRILLETQLKNCNTIIQCSEETGLSCEVVENGFRVLAEGGFSVPAGMVKWLTLNQPEFGEDVIANCARILRYEKLGILMASRIDPAIDWVSYFLNCDRSIVDAAQGLFDRESGIRGDELEGDIEPRKK